MKIINHFDENGMTIQEFFERFLLIYLEEKKQVKNTKNSGKIGKKMV